MMFSISFFADSVKRNEAQLAKHTFFEIHSPDFNQRKKTSSQNPRKFIFALETTFCSAILTFYTQWPWVSSQNWLTLQRLQNFKYTLRSNNLKINDAAYLIFSTLYCLSIRSSNILDLHGNLIIQRSDMSFT